MSAKVERPHLALDFSEAIKDSPAFRQDLQEHFEYFSKLQKRYDECTRAVELLIEHGQNYVATMYNFTALLNSLWSTMGVDEPSAHQSFQTLSEALGQVVNLNKSLIERSFPKLKSDMEVFTEGELTKLRETKSQFDTMSTAVSDSLAKRASVSRNCPQPLKDAKNALTAVGTCFAHTSLDYVAQINIAHSRKAFNLLEALNTICTDFSVHYKRGNESFEEIAEPHFARVAETINAIRAKSKIVERKMQDRHAIVPRDLYEMNTGLPTDPDVAMEGYLFKRSSKAFKSWHRRWFMIKGDKFMYVKKNGESLQSMVMEDNLKLCLVRPASSNVERSCCFELVSRNGNHLLQADSDILCSEWIRAIQRTIQHLHEGDPDGPTNQSFLKNIEITAAAAQRNGELSSEGSDRDSITSASSTASAPTPSKPTGFAVDSTFFEEIRRIPGNKLCADCGHADAKWVSINLGVVICIECSGAHRSLGVHVSKVRSLTMDAISDDQKNVLRALGNRKVNSIYLAALNEMDAVGTSATSTQLGPNSDRNAREQYITAKYVEKRFARSDTSLHNKSILNAALSAAHRSTSFHDRVSMDSAIPQSTLRRDDSNSDSRLNSSTDSHEKSMVEALRTGDAETVMREMVVGGIDLNSRLSNGSYPVHIAAENNQSLIVEFLLLNGALVNVVDEELNSPLHIAAFKGYTMEVYQFVKRSADKSLRNRKGDTPLDLAILAKNANIVTLLRLQDLRDSDQNDGVENAVDRFIDDLANDEAAARRNGDSPRT